MELKLDLHIHSAQSPDGCMSIEEIVARCRAAGLHGAAICDHNQVMGQVPDCGDFLLIPGVEVSTELGHLLGLFVSEPIVYRTFSYAVEAIHGQGGLAVVAHPFEYGDSSSGLIPHLSVLDGVEVWNSRADRKDRTANEQARMFAQKHGLRFFGGSDAHVPQEIGNAVVTVEVDTVSLENVKAALMNGNVSVSGRPSPARYAALSQLTKRRKTGASAGSYIKWAMFAAKCCIQDVMNRGGN